MSSPSAVRGDFFRLGLPRPPSWIQGVLFLREGQGRGREGRKEEGREMRRGGRGKEGKGEGCVMAFRGMDAPDVAYALSTGAKINDLG